MVDRTTGTDGVGNLSVGALGFKLVFTLASPVWMRSLPIIKAIRYRIE